MKLYSPTGRRNHGRPLKRLLDTWDRNGSTSGPTPWQIYDDDEYIKQHKHLIHYNKIQFLQYNSWQGWNTYMFGYWHAILRESSRTGEYKSNTQMHILLNHIAALVLQSYSFVFLWLLATFPGWGFANFMLLIPLFLQ